MTIYVKDVLTLAARMLGNLESVEKYWGNAAGTVGKRDAELLLSCFHTVENELALDYLPLMAEDELVTSTGVVEYARLEKKVARILCVEDEAGEPVKYKLFPNYLKTQAGRVKITYVYTPEEKSLAGAVEYQTGVSARLFAYGVAAEYSLAVGDTQSAAVWDKKFKAAIQAAYRLRPCKKIRSRRWI